MEAKPQEKEIAIRMRLEGNNYAEIREIVKVSKSSLSLWFSGLILSEEAKRILKEKKSSNAYRPKSSGIKRPRKQGKYSDRPEKIKLGVCNHRRRTKILAIEYKGGKCVICGYNKCNRALEFHHVDPTKKEFTISRYSRSWARIKKELDKCMLVCSNCHQEIEAGLVDCSAVA